jgi:hypothetical protein
MYAFRLLFRRLTSCQTRRWRKYGSKKLKGVADERRDYYRCTMAGCSAKKIVEIHVDKEGRQTDSCAYKARVCFPLGLRWHVAHALYL